MKKSLIGLLLGLIVLVNYGTVLASVQADVALATKAGRNVFLVVTEPGIVDTDKLLQVAREAHGLVPDSIVIEMDRADVANRELVIEYRLLSAPLPLILLVGANGTPAGSLRADQATSKNLVKMIPTPKKIEVMEALQDNKTAFVVVSRESMPDQAKLLARCKTAASQTTDRAAFIYIDMEDTREASFLEKLKVKSSATTPAIRVYSPRGKLVAIFNGSVSSAQLVQASARRSGGCCGNGGSCKLPQAGDAQ